MRVREWRWSYGQWCSRSGSGVCCSAPLARFRYRQQSFIRGHGEMGDGSDRLLLQCELCSALFCSHNEFIHCFLLLCALAVCRVGRMQSSFAFARTAEQHDST